MISKMRPKTSRPRSIPFEPNFKAVLVVINLNSEVEGTIPRSPGSRTFKFSNSAPRSAVSQPTGLVRGSFLGEKSL